MFIKDNILLVNPFSSQNFLIDELEKNFINYGTLISPSMKNKVSSEFKNIIYIKSDEDISTIEIEKLSKYKYKYIFYGSDSYIQLADNISKKIGLISINDLNKTKIRDNKFYLHQYFSKINSEYGIKQKIIKNRLNIKEIEKNINDFSFPIVAKPLKNSIGSCGVAICHNLSDLKNHIQKENLDVYGNKISDYFIQEFIEGEEYFVDTVSLNSNHVITCLCKHNKEIIGNNLVCLANDMWLDHKKEPAIWKKVHDLITDALNSTGLRNGFAHTEFMLKKDGKIKIIEINYRNSGGRGIVGMLSNYSYGRNQVSALCNLLKNKKISMIPDFIAYTTYIRIQNISNTDKIFYKNMLDFTKNLKTYKTTCIWADDGAIWKSAVLNSNVFEHPAAVVLYSQSLDDLKYDKDILINRMKNNFSIEGL